MDSVHDFSKGIAKWAPTHHLHWGYHLLWYRRDVFAGEDSATSRLCAGYSSLLWDQPKPYDRHTVPIPWPLLLCLFTRRHGVGSPIVSALVIRHFFGHLFPQRLILVTLTGLECAPTHTSSPAKGWVPVLVQLKAERNMLVFLIYLFSLMSLCYLNVV